MKDFIPFAIGAILIAGSMIFGIGFLIGMPFALAGGASGWGLAIFAFVDFLAFIGGIFLVRRH